MPLLRSLDFGLAWRVVLTYPHSGGTLAPRKRLHVSRSNLIRLEAFSPGARTSQIGQVGAASGVPRSSISAGIVTA